MGGIIDKIVDIFYWIFGRKINYDMNIYLCGKSLTKELAKKIFPKEIYSNTFALNFDDLKDNPFYKELTPKDKINWKAKIYLGNITKEISNKIHEDTKYSIIEETDKNKNDVKDAHKNEKNESFSAVIVCFEDDNYALILDKFKENNQFNMPFFIILSKDKKEFNFIDNRYITNIVYKDLNDKKTAEYLISILYFKDCYFNERGGDTWNFVPSNVFGALNKRSNESINIIVTGAPRMGKSSLINLLSKKLISLENDNQMAVTNKIKRYMIPLGENKEFNGHLKIIDTPGIIDKEHQQNLITIFDDIIKKEKIDLIFFLINPSTALDNCLDFLSFINNTNIKTIFIYNRCESPKDFEPLKNILKHFDNLYSENNENYLFMRLKETKVKKEINEEEENGDNIYETKNIYGFISLIKIIKEYAKKKNNITEGDKNRIINTYNKYIDYKNLLYKKYLENSGQEIKIEELEEKLTEIKNESTKLFEDLKNKYNLFKKFKTLNDVINSCKLNSTTNFLSWALSYGYFPWDILPTEDSLSFFGKENFKKIFSKEKDNYEELSNVINTQIAEKNNNSNSINSISSITNSFSNISIISSISSIIPAIGLIPICPLIFIPIASITSVFSIFFAIFHFLSQKNKYCIFFEKEIKKTGGIVLFKNLLSIQIN